MGSAAIQVGNVLITPTGDLVSGVTRSSASFTVSFPSSGGYTFDSTHILQMDTDLDQPTWTYNTILDGIENPSKTESGPNIRVSGWELSYPSSRTVSLKVKVDGTAPTVAISEEKIIFRVRETDSRNVVVGTEVVRKKLVINPATLGESIQTESARLTGIRSSLDQLAGSGLDLAGVETKYGQAAAYLQSSQQATDSTSKQSNLNNAKKLIDEMNATVAELQARHAIATAERSLQQTDEIITYLRVDKNMGSDAQLLSIITRWDIASDRLSGARDLFAEGDYQEAASRATDAATRGDQVLTEAAALKEKADSNPVANLFGGISGGISGILWPVLIIIVIVILVVAGIVIFRKRRRWDELG
ncbi:hypothetical protein ASZ90_014802 [hydrocarbon metagenome]|uniref:Uncharacterized protein n=1 Tax=hydrocarbon metagenome TaxID=938273 RepID=A0A0W8F3X6_9ZZZZ